MAAPETSPADRPTGDERGVARSADPLPVEVGDMLDLWSVDDLTARGHLVVAGAQLGRADAGSLRQRTYETKSPSTPRPTTTR